MYVWLSLVSVPSYSTDEALQFVRRLIAREDLAPTHWGESGNLRNEFAMESFSSFLRDLDPRDPDRCWQPSLRRVTGLRYLFTWVASEWKTGCRLSLSVVIPRRVRPDLGARWMA